MPFLFECPQCGVRRAIAEGTVGRRVRCPNCETLVEITLVGESPEATASSTSEAAEAALPLISGVAITAPSQQADWNLVAPTTGAPLQGVPILALADDEETEEPVRVRSKPEESEMDMTPMVDVTFQLLIFFMVTASFTMQRSLEIPAPQDTAAAAARSMQDLEQDEEYITVRIDQNSTFYVTAAQWNDEIECPSEQELLAKVREARQGSASARKMLVVAHGDAIHERVVVAIDAGISAGIEDVQLVSVEDDDNNF